MQHINISRFLILFGELAVEKRYILASGKPEVETSVVDDHSPSVQEKEVEVSATVTRKDKENAIEPVISDDTSVTTTANFHLITQEEEDITIMVRRAADALYDLVLAPIEKAKSLFQKTSIPVQLQPKKMHRT